MKVPEKLRNATFDLITRNITRLLKIHISYRFIRYYDETSLLLIRRSLVRAQVEEPKLRTPSAAMLKGLFFEQALSRLTDLQLLQ